MNIYFNAIKAIADILSQYNIVYSFHALQDGYQLIFPWCNGDVACHGFTYGSSAGMVETYQFPWDDGDVTMLSPGEAADRIIDFYNASVA